MYVSIYLQEREQLTASCVVYTQGYLRRRQSSKSRNGPPARLARRRACPKGAEILLYIYILLYGCVCYNPHAPVAPVAPCCGLLAVCPWRTAVLVSERRGEDVPVAALCERLVLANLHHHNWHRLQDQKHRPVSAECRVPCATIVVTYVSSHSLPFPSPCELVRSFVRSCQINVRCNPIDSFPCYLPCFPRWLPAFFSSVSSMFSLADIRYICIYTIVLLWIYIVYGGM